MQQFNREPQEATAAAAMGDIPGCLQSLQISIPYQADPLALYQKLCAHNRDNILLESAEVASKQSLKSLLMVDASLRLSCWGHCVEVSALTANGAQLLPWLQQRLQSLCQVSTASTDSICFDFSEAPAAGASDEDTRLRASSNLDPLRVIQQQLTEVAASANAESHPLSIFLGGIFAYDLVATFESLPEVPTGKNKCPDYVFYLAETLLVIDHQQQSTELLAAVLSGPKLHTEYQRICQRVGEIAALCQLPSQQLNLAPEPSKLKTESIALEPVATPTPAAFAEIVRQLQERVAAGDIFQVVPSRQFELPCPDSLSAYQALKRTNPSPYMFYIRAADFELFGASPESALKYDQTTNQVELYPIAGTRPRGKHADQSIHADLDSRYELDLRMDQKELAEHMMLVDLSRNDLARVAVPGTRYVADLLKVDRYSHVMHLVSRVVAQLADDLDALHAYRACMNMGTLVGAPKINAATLIRQVEQQRRGSYGGAVGYLSGNGDMDTCIVIRSAYVQDQVALVQAGAGVVYDSDPDSEVRETEVKAQAVIHAIQASLAAAQKESQA